MTFAQSNLAMELIRGTSLDEHVARGAMTAEQRLEMVASPIIVSASGTTSPLLVLISVSFGICRTIASITRGSGEELISLIFDSSADVKGKEVSSSTILM